MDDARELLAELREHWADGYWWADHLLLEMVLAALLTGTIGFMFTWAELELKAHYG